MKKDINYKEKDFKMINDAVDSIDGQITDSYFPLVEELEAHHVKNDLKKFLPIILYFSKDPLKDNDFDENDLIEYKRTVEYTQNIVSGLKLG